MSNTKGSMLISNANAVGTELVNQLGGTGYKPSEWSDAINLLGISDDDKASALAGITEGMYTGTERGAIKYSNCNAVGAMLNKKFSTNRGFKPVEWESAISKLTPLAEGNVSGSICNIVNGADDVPLKNWLVTLPASLDGYSEVNAVRSGKNLLQNLKYQATSNRVNIGQSDDGFSVFLRKGTYTLSVSSSINIRAYYRGELDGSNTLIWSTYSTSGSGTFTLSEDKNVRMWVIGQDGSVSTSDVLTIQLEVGSTATSYEAYEAPTQYTASLGRTIYGGQADIVNGEGVDDCLSYELDENDSWSAYSGATHSFWHNVATGEDRPIKQTEASESICNYCTYSSASPASAPDFSFLIQGGQRIVVTVDSTIDTVDKFKTWLSSHNLVFVCPASTPTDFTFTPITAETALGVNNFWADEGDSSITYRKDPDIPDPPVQLLNMNNNNTEENNNEGV